jgi:Skp family chaperone for outer membrane proteins
MRVKTMFVVAAFSLMLAAAGWAQTAPAQQKPAPPAPAGQTPPATQTPAKPAGQPAAQPAPPKPFPADAKIAYVDVQVIASNSAEGKAATARLDDLRKKKTAELADKNKQAQALQTKLDQGGSVLSDQARAATEKELEKLQRDIQFFQQDAQNEINEMTQQLQGEFQQKLQPVIEQIAVEKGLQMVFSIRDSGAIWANTALDISDEVIKRFDTASKAGTTKK